MRARKQRGDGEIFFIGATANEGMAIGVKSGIQWLCRIENLGNLMYYFLLYSGFQRTLVDDNIEQLL